MTTYLEGLNNELGYLKQQPKVDEDRVRQVEDAIKAEEAKNPAPVEPLEAPPVVETMEAAAVETAVAAKPKRRK